jgi:hypothetical protein
MSKAQTLKSIIKKGVSEKPSFGTNPWEPWSAKANIAEDAILNQYLISRGINPKHVTKDQKVAHSKTGQFLKWKRDHMIESLVEAVDKMDVVVFDIPLLIRMLEYAREDAKTDMDLHKVVEKLIHIRKKGVLTMKDYNFVTRLKEDLDLDESHVAIAMGQMMDDEGSMVLNQLDQMERAVKMVRDHIGTDYEKQLPAWVQSKLTLATDYIDTVGNYLSSKNEDVNEAASASIRMYKALQQAKEKREREERLGKELLNKKPPEQKPVQKEEVVAEVAPPGFEGTVKAMKKYKKIDNPWALAWSMKNKGYKSHKKADGTPKNEETELEEGRGYRHGVPSYHSFGRPRREDDEYHVPDPGRTHKITFNVSKDGGEKHHRTVTIMNSQKTHDEAKPAARAHLEKQGYTIHENTQDPMAASSMPNDCANSPDDVAPKDKNKKLIQMSKSARIIKNLYKKKGVKEETYDHEKEDKSVATYGKKPKMQKLNTGLEEPKAAAVLTGGTTMTGEKRDTIEIDPMMKMRKPISGKR